MIHDWVAAVSVSHDVVNLPLEKIGGLSSAVLSVTLVVSRFFASTVDNGVV